MDDLHSKFSSLLSKAANTANKLGKKKFSGQGHRLGTAGEHRPQSRHASQQSAQSAAAASSSSCNSRDVGGQTAGLPQSVAAGPGPKQSQQSDRYFPQNASAPRPLLAATEFDGFTAVFGSGAALDANRGTAVPPAAGQITTTSSGTPAAPRSANSAQPYHNSSTQRLAHHQQQQQQQYHVTVEHIEEMQHCLGLIASQPEAAGSSMEVLDKLLSNLASAPQEAKYRQIKLSNPRIQQCVVQVSGALEFLTAVGFQVHNSSGVAAAPAAANTDGVAVFTTDRQLELVQAGLQQLQQLLSAAQVAQHQLNQQRQLQAQQQQQQQQQAAATPDSRQACDDPVHSPAEAIRKPIQQPGAAADAERRSAPAITAVQLTLPGPAVVTIPRETKVLLPAAADTTVPDWFFERTGGELKAEYMAKWQTRQTSEVFASKSWKDAQLGRKPGPKPTEANIRIRFPEGVCLQGRFHVSEPVTAVYEWITGALRDPTMTYELIKPDRRQLLGAGTVGDAELAPAVLLSFWPLAGQQQLYDGNQYQASCLQDMLIAEAQAV